MNKEHRIILLAGPTGVGKTALSLDLAERLQSGVVNADSMQIYRHMDIGTAKPTMAERARVKHHLLDIANPDEIFDAARYLEVATPVIEVIHKQGKIPLVVGGTGLYMKVLTRGICEGAPSDQNIRQQLLKEQQRLGLPYLHRELLKVDPVLAERIHENDRQRIMRALEVYRITKTPLSHWQQQHRFQKSRYQTIKVFLFRSRQELYERINRRVHLMMEQGFLDEVKQLLKMGYSRNLKPLQALGYKHLIQYLSGDYSLESAVLEIQRATRHYAKRQLTWFRGDPEFSWMNPEDGQRVEDYILSAIESSLPSSSNSLNFP